MRHLGSGVHAGIGAARSLQLHFACQEILGGLAKLPLHRARVALLLPSTVLGSVVLDGQLPAFRFLRFRWGGFQFPSVAPPEVDDAMMNRFQEDSCSKVFANSSCAAMCWTWPSL